MTAARMYFDASPGAATRRRISSVMSSMITLNVRATEQDGSPRRLSKHERRETVDIDPFDRPLGPNPPQSACSHLDWANAWVLSPAPPDFDGRRGMGTGKASAAVGKERRTCVRADERAAGADGV